MPAGTAEPKPGIRDRFIHEMKRYLVVVIFLFFFFGAFTAYRRLLLASYEIDYVDYGWALIKAIVLGKVILIGELLHVGERFEGRPLIVSTLWKTLAFGMLIVAFAVLERLVGAWIHHRPLSEEFSFKGSDGYELLARIPLQIVALVPLFAFRELGRVLGEDRLEALFLRGRAAQPSH
ncbi:MAG TPA: hypothetical protein VGG91_11225 [Myxococcaceae bacterium]|jgi:hypothetical protein